MSDFRVGDRVRFTQSYLEEMYIDKGRPNRTAFNDAAFVKRRGVVEEIRDGTVWVRWEGYSTCGVEPEHLEPVSVIDRLASLSDDSTDSGGAS